MPTKIKTLCKRNARFQSKATSLALAIEKVLHDTAGDISGIADLLFD